MHPFIFKFGALQLSSYGLMLGVAFLVGMFLAKRRASVEGVSPEKIESLSVWLIVAGVFGSRFLHTFIENGSYYWSHPLEFFAFQKGGLSYLGGLFLATATAVYYCWKHKLPFWQVADILSPTLAIGLSFARVGCFMAGCCYGKVCDLPWGVTFTHPDTLAEPRCVPLHPAQLYEAFGSLFLFFFLIYWRKHRKFYGEICLAYFGIYGVIRWFNEFPKALKEFGDYSTAQFVAIPMAAMLLVWWYLRRKNRDQPAL